MGKTQCLKISDNEEENVKEMIEKDGKENLGFGKWFALRQLWNMFVQAEIALIYSRHLNVKYETVTLTLSACFQFFAFFDLHSLLSYSIHYTPTTAL